MNQNRWTCLTTALLTIVAPIASVRAQALSSSPAVSDPTSIPLSPQSLPIVTPLTVTELQTEAAIPATVQPVPVVSKLPIVKSISSSSNQSKKIARKASLPAANRQLPSTTTTASFFNPNSQLIAPITSQPNPSDSVVSHVNSVVPLPKVSTPAVGTLSNHQATAPTIIVRSENSAPTTIENSATAQVEGAQLPVATTIATASTSPVVTAPAQIASTIASNPPHAEGVREPVDVPSFEAGLPRFIFESERPQQIVATAIAQVDGEIVAPEPSIAIPVERPKQSNATNRAPATLTPSVKSAPLEQSVVPTIPTVPTATAPAVVPSKSTTVSTNRPADAVTPATFDKVVATHLGKASWYGSETSSKTANGEKYNPNALTAAHRNLPFGTNVRVTNLKTGKTVTVRINDRGPFRRGRIIDLSAGAADAIDMKSAGIGDVKVEVLGIQGLALLESAGAADAVEMKSAGISDVKVDEVLGIQGLALLESEE